MTRRDIVLTGDEIRERLTALPAWVHENGAIRRTFTTDGWRGSMLVANAIAFLCEAADHHADLLVTWPAVSVALSTHSAGGVTVRDLELAAVIEARVLWQPTADSALDGPRKPFVQG